MIVIALVIIAVLGIMVVLGSATLEGQNEKMHPPDGCEREGKNRERP